LVFGSFQAFALDGEFGLVTFEDVEIHVADDDEVWGREVAA
jgi:hypothetical protein